MSDTAPSDAAASSRKGAYTVVQHRWRSPLPGQGGTPVCATCGARRNQSTLNETCAGRGDGQYLPEEDYDPIP